MRQVVMAAAVAFQPGWSRVGAPIRGLASAVLRWLDHRRDLADAGDGHLSPPQ